MAKEKKQPKKTVITDPEEIKKYIEKVMKLGINYLEYSAEREAIKVSEEGAVWHEHIYSHKVKFNIKLEVR